MIIEWRPAWAGMSPTVAFQHIRRGIVYAGIPATMVLRFLRDRPLVRLTAAIGPTLFWGRDDGPWVPYDREARDQNAGQKIIDRPFPWCWGDVVWAEGRWDDQPFGVTLDRDLEIAQLVLGGPGSEAGVQAWLAEEMRPVDYLHELTPVERFEFRNGLALGPP